MSRGAGQGPPWPRRGQRCGSLQRLPSGRSRVPGTRAGMGDRRTARRQRRRRLQRGSRLSGGDEAMGAKRPRCSQGLVGTEDRTDLGGSAPILRLPPELLDHIVSFLPVRDMVALGQTCRYLRQACDSEGVWRRVCRRLCPRLRQEGTAGARPWKRAAILNYTKGLYFQTFGGRRRYLSKSVAPLLSHGYRKFLPTKEHVLVLDHGGTLFLLRNALVASAPGHLQWKRACRCVVLCRNAKDFTTDPRSDAGYRKYVYVLAAREPAAGAGRACDCVEVYLQSSGQRVFKMTFHAAMRFRQLVLVGQETERVLLLLTDKGALYFEVHAPGVYRDLFGTLQAFDPLDLQMPLALPLPAKVLSCALGYNHLGLLDEFGRLFMQGSNRYGQLGTGDKSDRGEPALVHGLKCPLDVWCGLNHSLALLRSRELGQAVLGCGCGAGGRLPGCPKGSATFVKLQVKVPLCASSLCSTRECLYLLSSHDIEGGPAYRELPPSRAPPPPESPGAQACEQYLSQLQGCPTLAGRLAKVREAVGALALPPCQKDFLWEALELIRRSARPRTPACS
ncbi:F-box only protein 24 isoform X3 [Mauremys reevesii]|uniref:F-box only protein 24 isoform X3 n=1 Tax=Mauremys reevesii TaxID=260615 RepID=UPI00193EDB27|nr:F-box only protein 24 isoform X3 [Mauremys reevesii]